MDKGRKRGEPRPISECRLVPCVVVLVASVLSAFTALFLAYQLHVLWHFICFLAFQH